MSGLYIKCPFCDEDDFDLYGLKLHLTKGYCDYYNDLTDAPKDEDEDKVGEIKHETSDAI